jgi:ribosomal-protein-alanine N-acetyltransferase
LIADLQIRNGSPDDLDAVVALDRATALLPHWPADQYATAITGDPEGEAAVRRILLVAYQATRLSGFAVVKIAQFAGDITSELETIAVAASSRRSGIGRTLCMEAIEWARRHRAASMELEVRSRNDAAISLYNWLGFVAEGTRRRYYDNPADDAVLMRLAL